MQNISKYHRAIVGCSAVVTASLAGFVESASAAGQLTNQNMQPQGAFLIAQTTNQSNAGGANVTTSPSGSFSPGGSVGGYNSSITGQARLLSSRISLAQSKYNTAANNLRQAQTPPPIVSRTIPLRRFGRQAVADIASCGCPNADVTTTPTERPELVAARAAEASTAAELAAARAEAQQFIESVQSSNAGRQVDNTLW
ncbi:hypothetical protein [Chamaesiphon sp.]|uniref:hypothetical protein n=1 Tax=Chamaesiphon sp. TaxID=2814140 RepID=UPI0035948A9F